MKSFLFPASATNLSVSDTTLALLALVGVVGLVVSASLGLRRSDPMGLGQAGLGLVLTLALGATVMFFAPASFSHSGERGFIASQTLADRCGVSGRDYSAWLREEVLPEGKLEPGESASLRGNNGNLQARFGSKGYRVTCATTL